MMCTEVISMVRHVQERHPLERLLSELHFCAGKGNEAGGIWDVLEVHMWIFPLTYSYMYTA